MSAYNDAWQDGYDEGFDKGEAEGEAENRKLLDENEQLSEALRQARDQVHVLEQKVRRLLSALRGAGVIEAQVERIADGGD